MEGANVVLSVARGLSGCSAQLRAQHMHSVCQLSVCSSVCAQSVCSCISACVLSVSMCSAGGSACVQLCVGNSAQAFLSLTLIVLCRSSCHGRPGPLQVNFDKGMQFTVLWTLLTKMDTCPWTVNFSWAAMMNPRMHSHALRTPGPSARQSHRPTLTQPLLSLQQLLFGTMLFN